MQVRIASWMWREEKKIYKTILETRMAPSELSKNAMRAAAVDKKENESARSRNDKEASVSLYGAEYYFLLK